MRISAIGLTVLLAVGLLASQAPAQLGGMDLVQALELGLVDAEFRGNGGQSVIGEIWGTPGGPRTLTIAPGTQFWAQLGGIGGNQRGGIGGNNRGGGVQGMGALGGGTINLGQNLQARVEIATACTNIGMREPGRRDVMVATRCPDDRVAKVAALATGPDVSHPVYQLAVWAIANDPPREMVDKYVTK
ncbi:MAG TPA: hypothetical protein QGH10_19595, partial [Armatimonadota bacterium]|nr:hypothetical protein [Armatimonadota bacterium]